MSTEAEIMLDLDAVYGGLSPENLTWDGERPKSESERERKQLERRLKILFSELGREVSDWEVLQFFESRRPDRKE